MSKPAPLCSKHCNIPIGYCATLTGPDECIVCTQTKPKMFDAYYTEDEVIMGTLENELAEARRTIAEYEHETETIKELRAVADAHAGDAMCARAERDEARALCSKLAQALELSLNDEYVSDYASNKGREALAEYENAQKADK